MSNSLLINAAELLRRPGSERRSTLEPTIAELGIVDRRFDARCVGRGRPATGVADRRHRRRRHSSGRRGRILPSLPGTGAGEVVCDVDELYQHVVTDPDAFEIVGDQIDLARMVRENVLSGCAARAVVPARLRRAVPDLRHRPQHRHVRLRQHGRRSQVGCVEPAQGESARAVAATRISPANLS